MWGKEKERIERSEWDRLERELKLNWETEVKTIKANHVLELKEKDFELKHFKDEEIKKLRETIQLKEKTIATLEAKNAMLDKIVDLNAGIIDVKKLVETLIQKIPTFDLKNLTINSTQGK